VNSRQGLGIGAALTPASHHRPDPQRGRRHVTARL